MSEVMEMIFGNEFFQLPMLEALSYIAALLMVGAAIVGVSRRTLGMASPSSDVISVEEPFGGEWREAA